MVRVGEEQNFLFRTTSLCEDPGHVTKRIYLDPLSQRRYFFFCKLCMAFSIIGRITQTYCRQ
jgi:hypothetical protein